MRRYCLQNAKVLEDAATALATGENQTTSQCSKWTTQSGRTEEVALGTSTNACKSYASSNRDLNNFIDSEGISCVGSNTNNEKDFEPLETNISGNLADSENSSSENLEDEEDTISTTVDTSEEDSRWEGVDIPTKESSETQESSEVNNDLISHCGS